MSTECKKLVVTQMTGDIQQWSAYILIIIKQYFFSAIVSCLLVISLRIIHTLLGINIFLPTLFSNVENVQNVSKQIVMNQAREN